MQRTGKLERKKVNTRDILFIVSGAFAGIEEIIAKRLNKSAIGFRVHSDQEAGSPDPGELLHHVRAEDLIEFGFESEFIGRLPVTAVLHELSEADLLGILRSPRSGVILAKKRDFRAYGIEIDFSDEALQLLASHAGEEHTGARGLVSVIERVLLQFEKRLPSVTVSRFTVTADVVRDPLTALDELVFESSLEQYRQEFAEQHQIQLSFTRAARESLQQRGAEEGVLPEELCGRLFVDYGHGLHLAGRGQFEIDASMVDAPQEELNRIIKQVYGGSEPG
jgi:ATP-dependent Clp protease ATP-binding subunit ClpX